MFTLIQLYPAFPAIEWASLGVWNLIGRILLKFSPKNVKLILFFNRNFLLCARLGQADRSENE